MVSNIKCEFEKVIQSTKKVRAGKAGMEFEICLVIFYSFGQIVILVWLEWVCLGGSPGLVVMGGDSCSESRGFESRHCILDGHVFTYICCKNCNEVCLKRPKTMKEAGVGTFF